MIDLHIEIEAPSALIAFEMFSGSSRLPSDAHPVRLHGGGAVIYTGILHRRDLRYPVSVSAIAVLPTESAIGQFSHWLYDKLKGKPARLFINQNKVEITAERIRLAVDMIRRITSE